MFASGFSLLVLLQFRKVFVSAARMKQCPEYARLESEVEATLARLSEVTTLELQLFRARNFAHVTRVDKKLEMIVGEKERAIGALRQHIREHKCQPAAL
jgi:hypothetical protein